MSVILSYADEYTAIIASDGRVTDKDLNVMDENYNKTIKINNNTIMGFSGSFENCQNIIKLIQNSEHKNFVKSLYPEDIVLFIQDVLSDFPKSIKCSFIVCGIGKNGKICSCNVQTGENAVIQYSSTGKQTYHGAYPSEEIAKLDIFPKALQKYFPDIMLAISETIQAISKLSPAVNGRVFYQTVHL